MGGGGVWTKYSSHAVLIPLQAFEEFVGFIQILNEAVKGKSLRDDIPASPVS